MKKQKTALVLGAGWAGLACAVELADKGFAVTVLEQSVRLGGRASSFVDKQTGHVLDNGQHLMMGCYHHTLDFLRKIGSANLLQVQPRLRVPFVDDQARQFDLSCPNWPAPLHLLAGILQLKTLTWRDKFSLFKIERAIKKSFDPAHQKQLQNISVLQWLQQCGQSHNAIKVLWEPICLATVNLALDQACAESFVTVLRLAFFANAQDACMVLPRVGLSQLAAYPARQYVQARAGQVLQHQLVTRIQADAQGVTAVWTRPGQKWTADVYVSALPFYALRNVMDQHWMQDSFFSGIQAMRSSPIFSIAVWIDRIVVDDLFYGLLNTRLQWVFNKNKIFDGAVQGQYLALVLSDAQKFLHLTNTEIFQFVWEEFCQAFPAARQAQVKNYLIQREKNATLAHHVNHQRLRPSQKTPLSNFYLCGDWTQTGLPATIESAVRSAALASQHIFY